MSAAESCLCGAVRFTVVAPLGSVTASHCTQCRKITGHHSAAVPAKWADIALSGTVAWHASSPGARRGFCGTCESSLFWDGAGQNLSIHAGTLDGATGLRLAGHIFCADKGDYYRISDDLPPTPGADGALTTMVAGP